MIIDDLVITNLAQKQERKVDAFDVPISDAFGYLSIFGGANCQFNPVYDGHMDPLLPLCIELMCHDSL